MTTPSITVNPQLSKPAQSFVFDPRMVYDPYNNRWIACAVVENDSSNSGILIGVSRTSNPTNTSDVGWNLEFAAGQS